MYLWSLSRSGLNSPTAKPLALAQFVKRVTWSAMRECAVDEAECYDIRAAVEILRRAVAKAGYAPR